MEITISAIITELENIAPLSLQESYDNAGLITGSGSSICTGVLVSLDCTEAVIQEAIARNCNLVISHHPIIFSGLKKITGANYVQRTIIQAIKNDIAIYAIHTNLDNIKAGVNGIIADKLQLTNRSILSPKPSVLRKLFTFVPKDKAENVRQALFAAGAGHIGNYSECSFNSPGSGTFKAGAGTDPYVGDIGIRHQEEEVKVEVIFPAYIEKSLVKAMVSAHPYEEVAYDIVELSNAHPGIGSGIIGELTDAMAEVQFFQLVKQEFKLSVIRHTQFSGKPLKKIAVCGGSGSFLINTAILAGADCYITADVKYHEFFDANGKIVIADIGHFESEQFTVDLLIGILRQKYPNFAVLNSEVSTNPVHYFLG